MTTSDMIRTLCEKQNISLAELSRRIGQTPQNFNKKLKEVQFPSMRWWRLRRLWVWSMSRRLYCRMEKKFKLQKYELI